MFCRWFIDVFSNQRVDVRGEIFIIWFIFLTLVGFLCIFLTLNFIDFFYRFRWHACLVCLALCKNNKKMDGEWRKSKIVCLKIINGQNNAQHGNKKSATTGWYGLLVVNKSFFGNRNFLCSWNECCGINPEQICLENEKYRHGFKIKFLGVCLVDVGCFRVFDGLRWSKKNSFIDLGFLNFFYSLWKKFQKDTGLF